MLGASTVYAAEATETTCRDLEAQVRTALETSQQAGNQQAVKERESGRAYCTRGFYKIGAGHLTQALKLLGQKT